MSGLIFDGRRIHERKKEVSLTRCATIPGFIVEWVDFLTLSVHEPSDTVKRAHVELTRCFSDTFVTKQCLEEQAANAAGTPEEEDAFIGATSTELRNASARHVQGSEQASSESHVDQKRMSKAGQILIIVQIRRKLLLFFKGEGLA